MVGRQSNQKLSHQPLRSFHGTTWWPMFLNFTRNLGHWLSCSPLSRRENMAITLWLCLATHGAATLGISSIR